MKKRARCFVVVAALCGACGGESSSGASQGGTSSGGDAGAPDVGGATAGGGASTAGEGAGGTAGTGGSGVDCADLDCDICPFGYLKDAQGCDICACAAPPIIMDIEGVETALSNVTLTGASSWAPSSGRVGFGFEWLFDDPATEEEEIFINARLQMDESVVLSMDQVRTIHLPSTDPPVTVNAYRATFISAQAFPLTLMDGYLTIYPSASMDFSGSVYLVLQTEEGGQVIVAGEFDTTDG